ncbi:MAG TPA: hypothetical protein VF590_19815, partial [Isosphaeraceae bacterium]
MRRLSPAVVVLLLTGRVATAQDLPGGPASPRSGLPFATEPDRLPGPPRAMGELPVGESQPPSTLPGRLSGPPRAMGEAPPAGPTGGSTGFDFGRLAPLLPRTPPAAGTTALPLPFFLGIERPTGEGAARPAPRGDNLPPALSGRDAAAAPPAAEAIPGGIGTGPP